MLSVEIVPRDVETRVDELLHCQAEKLSYLPACFGLGWPGSSELSYSPSEAGHRDHLVLLTSPPALVLSLPFSGTDLFQPRLEYSKG